LAFPSPWLILGGRDGYRFGWMKSMKNSKNWTQIKTIEKVFRNITGYWWLTARISFQIT